MGVSDFVREAGAKIGIGDSKEEKAEAAKEAKAASDSRAAEVAKRVQERRDAVQDEIDVPDNAADESQMHVVVSGDTLSALAKTYLGDASKYPAIFEANRPMLSDPDKIYVGQVLRIPAA